MTCLLVYPSISKCNSSSSVILAVLTKDVYTKTLVLVYSSISMETISKDCNRLNKWIDTTQCTNKHLVVHCQAALIQLLQ
jgi:protein-tyrosine phosphatase